MEIVAKKRAQENDKRRTSERGSPVILLKNKGLWRFLLLACRETSALPRSPRSTVFGVNLGLPRPEESLLPFSLSCPTPCPTLS